MTAFLDDLLLARYPGLEYIHVFDDILRQAEDLEQANQKAITGVIRSRAEELTKGPSNCAKVAKDYVSVSAAVNRLENWVRTHYRSGQPREC